MRTSTATSSTTMGFTVIISAAEKLKTNTVATLCLSVLMARVRPTTMLMSHRGIPRKSLFLFYFIVKIKNGDI